MVAPEQGRKLAEDAIIKYLGVDSISCFEAKRNKIRKEFQRFKQLHPSLFNKLELQNELLPREDQDEEE